MTEPAEPADAEPADVEPADVEPADADAEPDPTPDRRGRGAEQRHYPFGPDL